MLKKRIKKLKEKKEIYSERGIKQKEDVNKEKKEKKKKRK